MSSPSIVILEFGGGVCEEMRQTVIPESVRKALENAGSPAGRAFGWAYFLYRLAHDAYARNEPENGDRLEDEADGYAIKGQKLLRARVTNAGAGAN